MKQWILPKMIPANLILLFLLLTSASCGLRDNPESSADAESSAAVQANPEQSSAEAPPSSNNPEEPVAVADYSYISLEIPLFASSGDQKYTITGEWLYYTEPVLHEEDGECYNHISRTQIAADGQQKDFIICQTPMQDLFISAMLADPAGNCYLFSVPRGVNNIDGLCYLEKYGTTGELLWQVSYEQEELQDMAPRLTQGAVTENGAVYLYGPDGMVFSFDTEGRLETVYTPELESLEGIVIGKDDRAYAYCVTGREPLFAEIGSGELYVSPIVPLAVYDGYGDGIYLRTGEGLWRWEPESGETEYLWGWKDAYIQLNGNHVDKILRTGETFVLLAFEQASRSIYEREVLTFASITFESMLDYPGKQPITLSGQAFESEWLLYMIRMYNRHSKEYSIEIVQEKNESSLEMKLLKGECSDLIELTGVYAENLAEKGAFEDLTPYYEASENVEWESILEPVRAACTIGGKNVIVIPAFYLQTMIAKEPIAAEDWTVWKFLELGEGAHIFMIQSPGSVFHYCMGLKYGDHFVDFEKKECYFDGTEFRRILEACGNVESYGEIQMNTPIVDKFWEGDWLLSDMLIFDALGAVNHLDKAYGEKLIGYPGWEGAEYEMRDSAIFAINSKSPNKEGAWDFLEYLLSDELQSMINWTFPVREEYFEAYLLNPYQEPNYMYDGSTGAILGFNEFYERKEPDEETFLKVRKMVDLSVYNNWGGRNNVIWQIVSEETEMYFAGDATLDETVHKIQNRVQVYLDEQ